MTRLGDVYLLSSDVKSRRSGAITVAYGKQHGSRTIWFADRSVMFPNPRLYMLDDFTTLMLWGPGTRNFYIGNIYLRDNLKRVYAGDLYFCLPKGDRYG